jgi:hypothetical protein
MHILIGALVGMVVSVGLTYVASKVIRRPLTWKDVAASAMAGIIGGAVATATLGVGAATTARTVVAFSAGGATGSASGQITDNVLHGHPVHEGVVKSTVVGTAIGAATLGVGKGLGHAGRAVGIGSRSAGAAAAGHGGGHSNALAGAAAGLDDAVVPVWRYVKKALARDPVEDDASQVADGHGDGARAGARQVDLPLGVDAPASASQEAHGLVEDRPGLEGRPTSQAAAVPAPEGRRGALGKLGDTLD